MNEYAHRLTTSTALLDRCVADFEALRAEPDSVDKALTLWASCYRYGRERMARLPGASVALIDQLLMGERDELGSGVVGTLVNQARFGEKAGAEYIEQVVDFAASALSKSRKWQQRTR
jgi:hypothetical protein